MAPRFERKLALLLKPEPVYGTDSVPTGAANAIRATDVAFTPSQGGEDRHDFILPHMGHQGVELTDEHVQIEFSIEIAGAGAAGTAPKYGPALRACGMAETLNAGVSAVYKPVSGTFEAASIYYNLDGVNHILVGNRGNVTAELTPQRIPRFRFRMLGLKGTVADTALPTVDHTGFVKAKPMTDANTTLALHGYTGPIEAFSFDLGQRVEPDFLFNQETIEITDRQMTGSATVRAGLLADKNWFAAVEARTRAAQAMQIGTVAGNIVDLGGPAVELGRPTQGFTRGMANLRFPLMYCPTAAGNDEFTITVR
jgi:hypothetical protein